MDFAIIAAGEGSRLKTEGIKTPKPLVKINGQTLLERLIKKFAAANADNIYIIHRSSQPAVAGHLNNIQQQFCTQSRPPEVHIVQENTPSSMHSLYELVRKTTLGTRPFILTTVDTVFNDVAFSEYVHLFEHLVTVGKADALLATTPYVNDEKPLYITFDSHDNVTHIHDKPHKVQSTESHTHVSAGIYGLTPVAIPILEKCILTGKERMRSFQKALLGEGLHIKAFNMNTVIDVDHIEDINKAEQIDSQYTSPSKPSAVRTDTICALATPKGGAIGIIRVSGEMALEAADNIFSKDILTAKPYTLHHGNILDGNETVDEVMLSVFRQPHSYTAEDTVEIACHGSPYVISRILHLLLSQGLRMAEPGEFTKRAFLNGKMDLTRAEAVADLIESRTKAMHKMAISQMRGGLSSRLGKLKDELLRLTSLVELELDFSDHEDLEFANRSQLAQLVHDIKAHIKVLADTYQRGQALKNGIAVAIVGKTNVGKSTLLNRLLNDNRAIVSDIQGTTRDTIEDTIELGGITFRFIDTAGIRHTDDTIEQIGIQRTYAAMAKAHIILYMIDEEPTRKELDEIKNTIKRSSTTIESRENADKPHHTPFNAKPQIIIVRNKVDLKSPTRYSPSSSSPSFSSRSIEQNSADDSKKTFASQVLFPYPYVEISASMGSGVEELEQMIQTMSGAADLDDTEVIVTCARHYDALCRAQVSIESVIEALNSDISLELLAEHLRNTISILAEITGEQITATDVLSNIFQHFCVGK